MAQELNPLTGLPGDEKKPTRKRGSLYEGPLKSSGLTKSQTSPMKDLIAPVDISKSIPEEAPEKMVQLADYRDFTANPDYGKIIDKYNKNHELAKAKYLKQLDDEQNILESTAAGVGKFLTKTVAGTGLGLLGTGWGAAKALFTLDANQLIESNIFTDAEEGIKKWADKTMPIYSDNPNYHQLGFMDKLMTEPGKLFGDEVTDALAFTASAIGQELILSAATAATFGATAPIQASASVRLAKRGYDLVKGLSKAKKYAKAADMAGDIAKMTNNFKQASQAAKLSNIMKNSGATALGLATATHYEAAIEARGTYDAMMDKYVENFINSNGREPREAEIEQGKKLAQDAMWATYGMNAAILSASNLIQFSSVFNKGYKGYKSTMKAAGNITREAGEYSTKFAGKSRFGKLMTYGYLVGKNPVTESMEEFLQGVAHEGALDYFGRQYSPEHNENSLGFFGTYGAAAVDYFQSKEGGNSMGIGAIVGLLGLPMGKRGWSGGVIGEISDFNKNLKAAEQLVQSLNSSNFKSALKENYKNAVVLSSLAEEKQAAAAADDIFQFKNLEADEMFSYMYNRVKLGLKDDVLDDISKLDEMSLEDFNKEFASPESEEFTASQKDKTIQKAKDLVESIEENTKAAEHIIEYNLRNRKGEEADKLRANAEKVKPYLIHAASTLNNVDIREKELTKRLTEISNLNEEDITNLAKQSKHFTKLNRLSQLAKKEKKGNELNEKEQQERNTLLSELKVQREEFKRLYEEKVDPVTVDDIRNISGAFENLELGVDQTDFMKAAQAKVEEYAQANPTRATINKGEMLNIFEDIAKLKNRRETFKKYYDYLATAEGVEAMAKSINAAEEALAKEQSTKQEAETVKAAEEAVTADAAARAKMKAEQASDEVQAKYKDTVDKKTNEQAKKAPKFNGETAGKAKESIMQRYEGRPELQQEEAEAISEILQKYNEAPLTPDEKTDPQMLGVKFQRLFIPGKYDVRLVDEIKSLFSKIDNAVEIENSIDSYEPKENGKEVPTVDIDETEVVNSYDTSEYYFAPSVINVWQYKWNRELKKFDRENGVLVKADPLTTEKNMPDFDYINQGNLKVGAPLSLVVDTSEVDTRINSKESFINNFKILITTEVAGEKKVLGLLPSFKKDATKSEEGNALLTTRTRIYEDLVKKGIVDSQLNYTTDAVIDTGFGTTVTGVDAGRIHVAYGLRQPVSEVLGSGFKLGIVRKTKEGAPYLDVPNFSGNFFPPVNLTPGSVYAMVPNAKGNFTPVNLITRDLNDEEKASIRPVLEEAGNAFDMALDTGITLVEAHVAARAILDKLASTVYVGDISPYDVTTEGVPVFTIEYFDGAKEQLTIDEVEELLSNRKAQVELSKVNRVVGGQEYNQTIDGDKITTNLVKGEPIHSATFRIGHFSKNDESTFSELKNTEEEKREGAKTPSTSSETAVNTEAKIKELDQEMASKLANFSNALDRLQGERQQSLLLKTWNKNYEGGLTEFEGYSEQEIKDLVTKMVTNFYNAKKAEVLGTSEVVQESVNVTSARRRPAPNRPNNKGFNGDPNFKKGPVARKKIANKEKYEKWDKEKSLKWLRKNLPNIPVHILDDLKNIAELGGKTAWGLFKNASIYLASDAERTTAYHEAFHAIFWLSLNEKQRFDLLAEAQRETGLTDDIELEEWIADKFEEYIISNVLDQSLGAKIKAWFKRIWATIRGVRNEHLTLNKLFENINNGVYRKTSIEGKNVDILRAKLKDFTVNESADWSEMLASMFINRVQAIQDSNPLKSYGDIINSYKYDIYNAKGETETLVGPNAIFAELYTEDLWYRNDAIVDIIDSNYDWSVIEQTEGYKEAPEIYDMYRGQSKEYIDYASRQYELILNQFDVTGMPLSNNRGLISESLKGLRKYGIKINLKTKTSESEGQIQEQEYTDQIEEGVTTFESYQYDRAEVSGKDTISAFVKLKLSKYNETAKINGEVETVYNDLGYPKKMEFARVFNSLKEDLVNTFTITEMLDKLKELSNQKPYYDGIIQDLQTDSRFRAGFVHALATIRMNYVSAIQDWKGDYNIIGSNRNSPELTVRKEWSANFVLLQRQGKIKGAKTVEELKQKRSKLLSKLRVVSSDNYDIVSQDVAEFLNELGIDLIAEEIELNPTVINSFLNKGVLFLFDAIEKDLNPFALEDTGEGSSIIPLVEIAIKTRNDLYETSFLNIEGKQVFSNQVPNHMRKLEQMLTGENSEEFIKFLMQDDFYKENLWLKELITNTDAKELFKLLAFDGIKKQNEDGVKYSGLTSKDRLLTDLLFYYNKWNNKEGEAAMYSFPILSDAPQLPFVRFKKYTKEEVKEHLFNVIVQEYTRNKAIEKDLKRYKEGKIKKEQLIENYHYTMKGGEMVLVTPKYHHVSNMGAWSPLSKTNRAKTMEVVDAFLKKEVDTIKQSIKNFSITNNSINTSLSNEEFNTFIENYVHNQTLALIQTLQLFGGDPAFYKSQVDLGKRFKQTSAPGSILDTTEIGEVYRTIYVQDIEKPSNFLDIYKEVLTGVSERQRKEILAGYGEVNLADGQALISLKRYKDILTATGEWTPAHDKAYPKMVKGEATKQEMTLFMQPLKPFYFGTTYNEEFEKMVPVQNKNSEFVVFPQMLNMPSLSASAKKRIETILEIFDNNVESVQFESSVKVGKSGLLNFDDINSNNIPTIAKDAHILYNKDYNIQLSVPEHHIDANILLGSQIRKLVIANIDLNNTEAIYDLNGESLTGRELFDLYQKTTVSNIEEEAALLEEIFNSSSKLSEILEEEMVSRGASRKYIDAVGESNGEFDYPLFMPLAASRNENVMSALFRNRIARQKIKGGSFVQVSDFVFGEELKVTTKEVNGKTVIDSMEALLPWWSKKYFPIDENGIVDITQIPDNLKELIGFRIPTEDKYSMVTIKVVGFTPQTAGGVVALPADITRKAGTDFDVDKLFIMMPEFETIYEETGKKIQKVESGSETKASRNNLLLDIMRSILQNPEHQAELLTPGSYDILKDLADPKNPNSIISRLGLSKEEINMSLPSSQIELFSRNMAAKTLIGMFANHSANHSMVQYSKIALRNPIKLTLESGERHELKELGLQRNIENTLISTQIAQNSAASVDNAKDPVLSMLNINEYTADVLALLIRTGLPLKDAVAVINVPSVRALIDKVKNGIEYDNAVRLTEGEILSKYKVHPFPNIGTLDMREIQGTIIGKAEVSENFKFDYGQGLWNSLKIFENLKDKADDLATLVAAARADSTGSKGLASNAYFEERIDRIIKSKTFVEGTVKDFFYGDVYPMLKAFTQKGIINANYHIGKYLPFQKGKFKQVKEELEVIKGSKLKESEQNLVDSHILTYISSRFDFFNISREESKDILANFPQEFQEFIKHRNNLKDNKFIQVVSFQEKFVPETEFAEIKGSRLIDKLITNNASRLEETQKEKIEDAFEEMFSDKRYREFAEKIIKYGFLAGGFNFNPTNFMALLPISIFKEIQDNSGKDFVQYLKDNINNFEVNDFLDKFVPNVFRSSNLVKRYNKSGENSILDHYDVLEYYSTYGKNNDLGTITSIVMRSEFFDKLGYDGTVIEQYSPQFISLNDEEGTLYKKEYEAEGTSEVMYTLVPEINGDGGYMQYTSDLGIDHSYFDYHLSRLELFSDFVKQGAIKYKGADSLRDLQRGKFIHNLDDFTEIVNAEYLEGEKPGIDDVITNIESFEEAVEELDEISISESEEVTSEETVVKKPEAASSQSLSSTSTDFDKGNESFSFGGWFKVDPFVGTSAQTENVFTISKIEFNKNAFNTFISKNKFYGNESYELLTPEDFDEVNRRGAYQINDDVNDIVSMETIISREIASRYPSNNPTIIQSFDDIVNYIQNPPEGNTLKDKLTREAYESVIKSFDLKVNPKISPLKNLEKSKESSTFVEEEYKDEELEQIEAENRARREANKAKKGKRVSSALLKISSQPQIEKPATGTILDSANFKGEVLDNIFPNMEEAEKFILDNGYSGVPFWNLDKFQVKVIPNVKDGDSDINEEDLDNLDKCVK